MQLNRNKSCPTFEWDCIVEDAISGVSANDGFYIF